jgi:hypothetical protein
MRQKRIGRENTNTRTTETSSKDIRFIPFQNTPAIIQGAIIHIKVYTTTYGYKEKV